MTSNNKVDSFPDDDDKSDECISLRYEPYGSSITSDFDVSSSYEKYWDSVISDSDSPKFSDNDCSKLSQLVAPEVSINSTGDVANMIKQWEKYVAEKNKKRIFLPKHSHCYQFPRWRSCDALTASLIVTTDNISVPVDNSLSTNCFKMQRNTKINKEELDRRNVLSAANDTIYDQNDRINLINSKSKKMSSSNSNIEEINSMHSNVLQLDHKPWYDRKMIRENIIRDSIANSTETRKLFENGLIIKEINKCYKPICYDEATLQQNHENIPEVTHFAVEIQPLSKGYKERMEELETDEVYVESERDSVGYGFRRTAGIHSYCLNEKEREILSFLNANIDAVEDLGIIIPQSVKRMMKEENPEKLQITQISTSYNQRSTPEQRNIATRRRLYRVNSIQINSTESSLTSKSESTRLTSNYPSRQESFSAVYQQN
uniref:Uncharacterized protein n=1 Tax=Setaria digitata TaxID=48799 RepID=A0A915PTN3_9BILA